MAGLLGIAPFVMCKAVGAVLTAEARVASVRARAGATRAEGLVELLLNTGGRGDDGSWGYEFDVQTRWGYYPAGTPNIIATVFVGRGLAGAGVAFEREDWLAEAHRAADWVSRTLSTVDAAGRPYFRYVAHSDILVHNANLLGAGLVAAMGRLRGDEPMVGLAAACASTSVHAQREDGGWAYGEGANLGWEDSFHTAYDLDGLLQMRLASPCDAWDRALDRGARHWGREFFGPSGEPFYTPGKGPYDIHSASTAVDTATRLRSWGIDSAVDPSAIVRWTEANLVDPRTGATRYRRYPAFLDRRHFVRWGDAHWALARSARALAQGPGRDPLEAAVFAATESDA